MIFFLFDILVCVFCIKIGNYTHVYDPSIEEQEEWYINDHCFIEGRNQTIHIIGITHQEPAEPLNENHFGHAIAFDDNLLQEMYVKQDDVLVAQKPETLLWAPHIIFHNSTYFMFYCGGGYDFFAFQIRLAISEDLIKWTRIGTLFRDGFEARDPMVLQLGPSEWIMYYSATSTRFGGDYTVNYRTSKDLYHWSEDAKEAFRFDKFGWTGSRTESPFVVKRNDWFYLFIGTSKESEYEIVNVFRSKSPVVWEQESDFIGSLHAHASEVVLWKDNYYVSSCGWGKKGVYLAPLFFEDD